MIKYNWNSIIKIILKAEIESEVELLVQQKLKINCNKHNSTRNELELILQLFWQVKHHYWAVIECKCLHRLHCAEVCVLLLTLLNVHNNEKKTEQQKLHLFAIMYKHSFWNVKFKIYNPSQGQMASMQECKWTIIQQNGTNSLLLHE